MEIKRIFGENLWSVVWPGRKRDAFSEAFTHWQDIEYLEAFFEKHRQDLQFGFYRFASVEEAVWATIQEAKEMESRLLKLARNSRLGILPDIDSLFVPLHDQAYRAEQLGKRKAKGPHRHTWLRMYAIKIDVGCYLVVGSAIKLSRTMDERDHTREELKHLEKVREYLRGHGIADYEGFMELVL